MRIHGCSPTLDTNSAHNNLQISLDLRTVTLTNVSQGRRKHPHELAYLQVLCSESFSSGQHYWEVDVGDVQRCRIGVAYGTIPRKGDDAKCLLGGSDVSWSLRKHNDRYSVWHGGVQTPLSVLEPPRRVGVHLDWNAGLLSYYSADSMVLLHSVHHIFTKPLYPGLRVGGQVGNFARIMDLSHAS